MLFEEFFLQGDLEKEKSLPVSFLCDRETTNVAKNQPGFSNFIVIPLFTHLAELMPNLKPMLVQCKANTELWTHYSESEEDKQVYAKKSVVAQILPGVDEKISVENSDSGSDCSDVST